ncbi:MAG: hypothetical protein ACRDRT_07625 [Pseudonocardiaceae bacterium]
MKTVFDKGEINKLFEGAAPATSDDVTITRDGRHLDTPEKFIAWLEEYNATISDAPRA